MIAIIPASVTKRMWKCIGFWNISVRQGKLLRLVRCYSTDKRDHTPEKKTILQKLEGGFQFGKWKFYAQELVFKNLQPDSVPSSYKMCYRSGLETYANVAILVAASAAIGIPAFVSYQLLQMNVGIDTQELAAFLTVGIASIIATYTLSLRVPLRIYYSAKCDDFLVYFPHLIPYATKRINIQPGHVLPPTSSSGYFPWVNIQHIHTQTNQKMLIDGDKFILPMYYNKLMGY